MVLFLDSLKIPGGLHQISISKKFFTHFSETSYRLMGNMVLFLTVLMEVYDIEINEFLTANCSFTKYCF